MPSAPNIVVAGGEYELTYRTEEGLPLVPSRTMEKICRSYLAAAATKYKIRPTAVKVMGNHVHKKVIVDDPADLPDFVEYFKRETSHAINKLLGRTQRTVWKRGYDPVRILDAEKSFDRTVYFYLNAARANLVESIDDYPGFSTWQNGFEETFTLTEDHIARDTVPTLSFPSLTDQQDLRIVHDLAEKSNKQYSVEIDCLAWMECYEETRNGDRAAMAQRIRDAVYSEERRLASLRKFPVIGASTLRRQSMRKAHTPKKFGKRMICMSSDIERRKEYICWFKSLVAEREKLKKKLSPREFLARVFPGFFRPGGYMDACLTPIFVPF